MKTDFINYFTKENFLKNYQVSLMRLDYIICEFNNKKLLLGIQFPLIKEIVRIVKNAKADMLVMGAHRHRGLKDYIFGETIESVRHELAIPVLIVNV